MASLFYQSYGCRAFASIPHGETSFLDAQKPQYFIDGISNWQVSKREYEVVSYFLGSDDPLVRNTNRKPSPMGTVTSTMSDRAQSWGTTLFCVEH